MVKQIITPSTDLEIIALELLLSGIQKRYGYDFTGYAKSSLKRRVKEFIERYSFSNYYDLIEKILIDKNLFEKFLFHVTIGVTEMFRDPLFYREIRKKVVPLLRTYPSIKIWVAGCSTGEEAFSLAILLKEEGLLNRTKIFATDLNEEFINLAKIGVYSIDKIKKFTENYIKFNGRCDFSDYYRVKYDFAALDYELRNKITFFNHNLVSDNVFQKFNLLLCRNVLIYFNRELQNNVLQLLNHSLENCGFICLGMKETLSTTILEDKFEAVDQKTKIYKKLIGL